VIYFTDDSFSNPSETMHVARLDEQEDEYEIVRLFVVWISIISCSQDDVPNGRGFVGQDRDTAFRCVLDRGAYPTDRSLCVPLVPKHDVVSVVGPLQRPSIYRSVPCNT
jgi:hypothetical protein